MKSNIIIIFLCYIRVCSSFIYNGQIFQAKGKLKPFGNTDLSPLFSSKKGDGDDVVNRRRKRRGEPQTEVDTSKVLPSPPTKTRQVDEASIEDKFGLGDNQLRELLEQELPVPREDLITGKTIEEEKRDNDKVFSLPDLDEFIKDTTGTRGVEKQAKQDAKDAIKIDRRNTEEYLRVLQLNPFADADESMFLNEYDVFLDIFGTGKLLNIPIPYLQTGHGILSIILLLGAFLYAPGNPLTEFPLEIRTFLKQSLLVTYSINAVLGVLAFQKARALNLPAIFWAIKCFLLGGVAFYEISRAKDPSKMNEAPIPDPSDRKSRRR